MPPMVTLTGALKGLPLKNGVRTSIYQSKKEIEGLSKVTSKHTIKRVQYKTKTDMAPIVLRPQTQIFSQSQSISPVKAQTYKLQQKMEASRNVDMVSPFEVSHKDQKKKYSQIKKTMKSDERKNTSTQLDTVKLQTMKSISPVKNIAKQLLNNIIEKNGSKQTTTTSNLQGDMSSPTEQPPQYFCFNDFESSAQQPKCQKSGSGQKKLLFHKEKYSIFNKNYGSNNSKEELGRNSITYNKSQMLHKNGQQSIYKSISSKKSNDYSQKLLSNISKGLSSLTVEKQPSTLSSGLGLGQANKRLQTNNAHK